MTYIFIFSEKTLIFSSSALPLALGTTLPPVRTTKAPLQNDVSDSGYRVKLNCRRRTAALGALRLDLETALVDEVEGLDGVSGVKDT